MIDDALWVWFIQERQRGAPLSGTIVRGKAVHFHKKLNCGDEFLASEG
jgi:hypothetical protein